MSKRKLLMVFMVALIAILTNLYVFRMVKPDIDSATGDIVIEMASNKALEIQTFYANDLEFQADKMKGESYKEAFTKQKLNMLIDLNSKYIRIDLGDIDNSTEVYAVTLNVAGKLVDIDLDKFAKPMVQNQIQRITKEEGCVRIDSVGNDPYLVISLEDKNIEKIYNQQLKNRYLIYDIILCVVIDMLCLLCLKNYRKLIAVPLNLIRDRKMVWNLSKNDFQARFVGSYLGIIWAFVQPVILMLLYWFVFQVGLRAGNVSNYPFILFLMTGLIPWFYFSEALNGGTSALTEYSYLVKKVVFKIEILPAIKVISSIFVHLFFVIFIIVVSAIYGYGPDVYLFQLIYYVICTFFLVLGLSYINSACMVFFRDTAQIVNIVLTIGVWITPIMWDPAGVLSPKLQLIFKLNPFYYIVDGFRDSILAKVCFWEKPVWTIYFWCFSIVVYYIGISVFDRLKPHFSDVL